MLKIRLSDTKIERVADLTNFVYTGHYSDSSMTLGPDDSPVLFRNAGTSDVFVLDWEEPQTARYVNPRNDFSFTRTSK